MAISKYRKDKRTDEQFAQDILDCTSIEQKLMQLYVDDLNKRKGGGYTFAAHGVDNKGKLIKDDKKVSTKADFLVTKNGISHKIEIKFSRPNNIDFHIKRSQLESYVKQDCCIIMFMGTDTDQIRYCIMLPQNYPHYLEHGQKKLLWGKDVIRFLIDDFVTYPVPRL